MRCTSVVPRLATSPASTWRGRSAPSRAAWRVTSCCTRTAAVRKFGDCAPVAEHAGDRLDHAQAEDHQRPGDQTALVAVDDCVHRAAECGGDQALGTHPDRAEEPAGGHGRSAACGRARRGT